MRLRCVAAGFALCLTLFIAGCGNDYYYDLFTANDEYRLHLGEPCYEVGTAAEGMAGAVRATTDSPAAVVNNPAGLGHIDKFTAEGGLLLSSRMLSWNATSTAPAQTNTFSIGGSYGAAALPLAGNRIVIGAAYWTPFDFTGAMGSDAAPGRIASSGGLHAISPALAVNLGKLRFGVAGDALIGAQKYEVTGNSTDASFDFSYTGYDVRAGLQAGGKLAPKISADCGVTGRWGARTNMGDYEMNYAPEAAAGFALHYGGLTGEVDAAYVFAEKMATTDPAARNALENTALDTYYFMAGASYRLGTGAVRAGYAYKPRLLSDAGYGRVNGTYYSIGGGWESFGGRGRIDAALRYGTRGSRAANNFSTSFINISLGTVIWF